MRHGSVHESLDEPGAVVLVGVDHLHLAGEALHVGTALNTVNISNRNTNLHVHNNTENSIQITLSHRKPIHRVTYELQAPK